MPIVCHSELLVKMSRAFMVWSFTLVLPSASHCLADNSSGFLPLRSALVILYGAAARTLGIVLNFSKVSVSLEKPILIGPRKNEVGPTRTEWDSVSFSNVSRSSNKCFPVIWPCDVTANKTSSSSFLISR